MGGNQSTWWEPTQPQSNFIQRRAHYARGKGGRGDFFKKQRVVSEASHKENTIQPAEQVNNTSKATETIHGKKNRKQKLTQLEPVPPLNVIKTRKLTTLKILYFDRCFKNLRCVATRPRNVKSVRYTPAYKTEFLVKVLLALCDNDSQLKANCSKRSR